VKQNALSMDGLRTAVLQRPNDALTEARHTALASLDEHGLPTVRQEDWKYTDLAPAIEISNRWLSQGAITASADSVFEACTAIMASIDANWLVVANGIVDTTHFVAASGIDVERFSDSAAPSPGDRPLGDLNAALLHDGLRVHIHAATEKPLGFLIIDDVAAGAAVSQASIEIEVSPGCDAELIEYQSSTGAGDHFGNSVVAMQVGQSASISYVRIQDRRIGHVQTGRLSVALGADSRLNMAAYDLGGGLIRNDVDIDIGESGTDANFTGLYLAGDGQHIDNHTRVDHRVGPATSSQEYRGILAGDCRCVWNGKAIVHQGADGTDASQENHNLLLSDNAEIDAKPELEIYADDVKCSHGTTVGQLDEAALFYLRTRGIDKLQATQMLTHAFAADLVGRTPITSAKTAVKSLVEKRLAQLIENDLS
jgi:Fe-S cluster assembly protein SufD